MILVLGHNYGFFSLQVTALWFSYERKSKKYHGNLKEKKESYQWGQVGHNAVSACAILALSKGNQWRLRWMGTVSFFLAVQTLCLMQVVSKFSPFFTLLGDWLTTPKDRRFSKMSEQCSCVSCNVIKFDTGSLQRPFVCTGVQAIHCCGVCPHMATRPYCNTSLGWFHWSDY
jgi:hypothetical protein